MIPAPVILTALQKALTSLGDVTGEWTIEAEPITQDRFAYTVTVSFVERADGPQYAEDDGHAISVGSPGGPIEPAVFCWATATGGRCVETLNVIDLVCSQHGKRRPPKGRGA